jgi:hypothetical protein
MRSFMRKSLIDREDTMPPSPKTDVTGLEVNANAW